MELGITTAEQFSPKIEKIIKKNRVIMTPNSVPTIIEELETKLEKQLELLNNGVLGFQQGLFHSIMNIEAAYTLAHLSTNYKTGIAGIGRKKFQEKVSESMAIDYLILANEHILKADELLPLYKNEIIANSKVGQRIIDVKKQVEGLTSFFGMKYISQDSLEENLSKNPKSIIIGFYETQKDSMFSKIITSRAENGLKEYVLRFILGYQLKNEKSVSMPNDTVMLGYFDHQEPSQKVMLSAPAKDYEKIMKDIAKTNTKVVYCN